MMSKLDMCSVCNLHVVFMSCCYVQLTVTCITSFLLLNAQDSLADQPQAKGYTSLQLSCTTSMVISATSTSSLFLTSSVS